MAGKESTVIDGPRRYFNVAHASDYTATTPSWIEERLRSGVLPYRWAGNRRVILRRDLDALMVGLPEEKGLCDPPAFMARCMGG
jgi:hypothetical protein